MKKLILCIVALSFMTGAFAQDNKLTPGPGEVELTYVGKNTQLGVWNPETRVYTIPAKYKDGPKAGQYRTLTFTDDGKVVNGDGKEVGSKQPNGSWKSPKIENVMRASYNVIWNNEIVGNIMQTIVSIHGLPMVQTSAPMDQDVLTFLVFCNHWGGDQINKIKEEVKKDDERKAAEARERAAKAKPVEYRKGRKADRIEMLGNHVVAKLKGQHIGTAEFSGNKIEIFNNTHHKTGQIGEVNLYTHAGETKRFGDSRIEFLGNNMAFRFHQDGTEKCTFGDERNVDVIGYVSHSISRYEVYVYQMNGQWRESKKIGEFPDNMDPRLGALFLYEFFDP